VVAARATASASMGVGLAVGAGGVSGVCHELGRHLHEAFAGSEQVGL
jgi:hypothetical protein